MNENTGPEKLKSLENASEDEDIIILLEEVVPSQDDEPILELTDSLDENTPDEEEDILDLIEPTEETATPVKADADEIIDLLEAAPSTMEPKDQITPLVLKTEPIESQTPDDEIALNLSALFDEPVHKPAANAAKIADSPEMADLQFFEPDERNGSLPLTFEDKEKDEQHLEPVISLSELFEEVTLPEEPQEEIAETVAADPEPETEEMKSPDNVVVAFEPKPNPLFVEPAVLADPLVDSLGINPSGGLPQIDADKGMGFIPPIPFEKEQTPDIQQDQLEAAIEQVIRKLYGEKIERLLIQAVERTVTEEIARLKAAILEKTEDNAID